MLKLFLVSVDVLKHENGLYATIVISSCFIIKVFINLFFLCNKYDLVYNTLPCYFVRVIFDFVVIVPITTYLALDERCHWITAAYVAGLIIISEIIVLTCCVNDARLRVLVLK